MIIAFFALLHLLVLVYWLGGDLGAFYGSSFLTDPARSVPERRMALKLLNNIDMAPRSALIVALPTGLTLAWAKAWLPVGGAWVVLVWAAGLAWLALAWAVHLRHDGAAGLRRADITLRWLFLAALWAIGGAGLAGAVKLPLFIAAKLIVLGACVGLGLMVRRQLVPLFPAVRAMIDAGPTPASDTAIARVIARTRPVVVGLWLLLLVAAWLGIATPT